MSRWRGLLAAVFLSLLWPGAAMSAFQDRFLYFPDILSAEQLQVQAKVENLVPWPASTDVRGLLAEPGGPARATAVVFHGNAGHALHRAWYAQILTAHGIRVILAEYPGYGSRPGPLGEEAYVADGAALVALVRRQYPGPLLVIGESLGAGVAAAVAARQPPDALLLITPWKDLAGVAGHHYPWLPTRWLLRDRYDSSTNLAGYRGAVGVVVAEQDQVIPPAFGRALFEALPPERKRLWLISGAGHNDWAERTNPQWWQEVLKALLPASPVP